MNIIVCVCDGLGMLFNKRRQSRDRVLIEEMIQSVGAENIIISEFSKSLFKDIEGIDAVTHLPLLTTDKYQFIENVSMKGFKSEINNLIVYFWNRKYPLDLQLGLDLENDFLLISETEFQGSSHEKITKKIFKARREKN